MGWEQRQYGDRYYYRSRRMNGRVVKEYVGAGPVAELAAHADAVRRTERTAQAEALHAEQARLAALDAPLETLCELTEALVHAALLESGYRRHKRGEWRRRRQHGRDDGSDGASRPAGSSWSTGPAGQRADAASEEGR